MEDQPYVAVIFCWPRTTSPRRRGCSGLFGLAPQVDGVVPAQAGLFRAGGSSKVFLAWRKPGVFGATNRLNSVTSDRY